MLFNKLMELPSSVDEQKKLIRSALLLPTAQIQPDMYIDIDVPSPTAQSSQICTCACTIMYHLSSRV